MCPDSWWQLANNIPSLGQPENVEQNTNPNKHHHEAMFTQLIQTQISDVCSWSDNKSHTRQLPKQANV